MNDIHERFGHALAAAIRAEQQATAARICLESYWREYQAEINTSLGYQKAKHSATREQLRKMAEKAAGDVFTAIDEAFTTLWPAHHG